MKYLICLIFFIMQSLVQADDSKLLRTLIQGLEGEAYEVRAKAHQDVLNWAYTNKSIASERLLAEIQQTDSPEVRVRLQDIVSEINKKPIGLGSMQVEFATALTGVKVNRCKLGGVGHLAGLQKGDVIEKIDGKVINTLGNTPENRLFQFQKMILEKREGKRLHLIVRTDKQRRVVIIILGKLDEQKLQKKEIIEQKKFKLEQ